MPERKVHAVCTHDCPDSCAVLVTVDEVTGRATRVQGDPAHPVTRGFLCGKVARYLDRVYASDRVLYPMRRKPSAGKGPRVQGQESEAFERVSWDQALAEIAARLGSIAAEHGSESILPYSYAGTIGQLGYGSMDRRFFYRLGASQLDRTICSAAGSEALTQVYGVRVGKRPEDFAHSGLILSWGGNIHGNNVHLWPFVEEARRDGARLVVIDPYRTRTAGLADQHLAIKPGTDTLFALAMMHVLFRDGLVDEAYLNTCTHGWRELREHALRAEHAPTVAAEITGIDANTMEELARAYGRAGQGGRKPAAIRLNYGIQRVENGGAAVRAVSMLPLLTGSWKQRGGGMLLSMSGAFGFNTSALQRPELMRRSPLGRDARMINMNELGNALTRPETNVHALFVYNSNAAAVAPDSAKVLAGLRRPELFTVVHEQFFTDTTDYADIVLPATTFLEHKDLMSSYGHTFAQISSPAIAPLGEARSNVWLFSQLGLRMGFEAAEFDVTEDSLIDEALVTSNPWLDGITRDRLEREGHIEVALPKDSEGRTLPFSDASWFRTPSGRAELLPVPAFVAPQESAANRAHDRKYPLQFLPRKSDNYMNSTFANLPSHQAMERRTEGVLELHNDDAHARGIREGDAVSVFNARGRIRLSATIAHARVAPGVVSARLDWQKLSTGGLNVNMLTSQRLSDMGGGATFYSTMVEVERAGTGQAQQQMKEAGPQTGEAGLQTGEAGPQTGEARPRTGEAGPQVSEVRQTIHEAQQR